jgi:hypothetical protein
MRDLPRALVFVLAICAAPTVSWAQQLEHRAPAPPSSRTWHTLVRSDTLVWSVDSASVSLSTRALAAWFAVVDTTQEMVARVEAPFRRFETLQEVDCATQHARGLRIRTPDQSGSTYISSVRDSTWRPFVGNPVSEHALRAACRRFLPMLRSSGDAAGAT